MNYIQYLISATICLSMAYCAFRLLFNNTSGFRQQRFFLISSVTISLLLPLTGIRFDIAGWFEKSSLSENSVTPLVTGNLNRIPAQGSHNGFSIYAGILEWIYVLLTFIFAMTILMHFIKIARIYYTSEKSLREKYIILNSTKIEDPFSFFKWIFIPSGIYDPEERKSIITHESIHVSQYHSIDNLLVELIAAAMWFNPLVWMMKKSFHLVHEYLADEGTLRSGIDRLRYQAFLLNRATEESLICLPSGFNQSLIKKRMIMMTKSKNYGRNKFRILALVPLSAVLLLIVSLLNGLFPQKAQAGNSGVKQPLISGSSVVTGSAIQDDTLKKKTYQITVDKQDQKVSKSKRVKVISDSHGKDTFTYITTSGSNGTDSVTYTIKTDSGSNGEDTVIYIVDGKCQTGVATIVPDSIESVNVIKNKKQVIVTLKKPVKVEKEIEVEVEPGEVENDIVVEPAEGEHEVVIVKKVKTSHDQIEVGPGKVSFPDDVVFYIDGKKASKAGVDEIDPETIESVSVFKGEGAKDAGVVKIVTKKPEVK